ncbi:sulfurtransferase-like selenium metabolism protein YedF [uncultured Pseudoflavonifractor sp.]|uniref:sulfurtransferase-like selenium metabolism protein YedF n=1 Tax=uncultured Pseudoflavonifractor sp. TaxID=1221379 RepID=UPI0025E6549E|nr:sulfurtransferase-like selenium metabolism protein YedF [uncultured Pseudoflavonifractor sp.]
MLKKVNAMGDPCPIPVIKTKNAIKELAGSGTVETLVDNEIAVQNLTRLASNSGYAVKSEKLGDKEFRVVMEVTGAPAAQTGEDDSETCLVPAGSGRNDTVVAVSSACMGTGSDELGAALMKSFLFALTQQDTLPKSILFYNGGAKLTTEGSASLEDLKSLEAQGVEILTCGTCLNFFGLSDKLQVGGVTNMYDIVEKMSSAGRVVRP